MEPAASAHRTGFADQAWELTRIPGTATGCRGWTYASHAAASMVHRYPA
jgi:hypothetical protein